MREPSLAGLLAAPRAACPCSLDHVLNPAGKGVIGSKVEKARFQMRGSVAVWQHAGEQSGPRAGGVDRAEGSPVRIRNPGSASSAGAHYRSSASQCDTGQGKPQGARQTAV
jgi:hypothetical protein